MTIRQKPKFRLTKTFVVIIIIAVIFGVWQLYTNHTQEAGATETNSHTGTQVPEPDTQTTPTPEPKATEKTKKKTSTKPKYNADDLQWVIIPEKTPSETVSYPGFTVSFNAKHHQPNWVAWELTRDEVKSNVVGGRKDLFAPDPRVKGCATGNDYRNSGYDRGHMAPAADMRWSHEANEACFRFTNMSPQTNALNTGAWNTLEEKCRNWAVRDSAIIIVCGPILTDRIRKKIGPTGVSVPSRYFKVVLAPYANPPRAIGFIMPNSRVNDGLENLAMSVDEVEDITGFNFFSALPNKIEKSVEKECNYPRWNQR